MKYRLLTLIIITVLFISYFFIYSKKNIILEKYLEFKSLKPTIKNEKDFPKIVHLIYFPWYRETGILKEKEDDFNHTFYKNFKNNNKDWEVKLWTLSKIKEFTKEYYPQYKDIWKLIKHPTQSVDFFRLLVTYHYGGIYWQYDSIQKIDLNCFIPSKNRTIRLFIECILNKNFSNTMKKEKIRNNKPEELLRIANQSFSSYPKNNFLNYCLEKSWKNLNNLTVNNQYDILYIGANAMISEAYDEYKNKDIIDLTYNTRRYIKFSSNGSWRLNSY